jgi:hypothetical protein
VSWMMRKGSGRPTSRASIRSTRASGTLG